MESCEIIFYICMWNIKNYIMYWWFRVFWYVLYSIDVLSLFYNYNKCLNCDGGYKLEMLYVLDSGWDYV